MGRWGFWSEQSDDGWGVFPGLAKSTQETIDKFIEEAGSNHVAAVLYAIHGEFRVDAANIDKAISLLSEQRQETDNEARIWAIDYEIRELEDAKRNGGYGVSTAVFDMMSFGLQLALLKIRNPTADEAINLLEKSSGRPLAEAAKDEVRSAWLKERGYNKIMFLMDFKVGLDDLKPFVIENPLDVRVGRLLNVTF